jgi:hypothetical protein
MIAYKDPIVELIPEPQALDLAIQKIQVKFANGLPWLHKAFGRATLQHEKAPESGEDKRVRRDIVIPEVYYKREPYNAMPNDNLQSHCFFFAKDPVTFLDWKAFTLDARTSQPLAIIFWMNLEKIDATKKYNFFEVLRGDVVKVLKNCSDFILEESSIQPDRVFAPFTITDNYRQYMKPPYAAFRFDGTLHYNYFNC